MQKLLLQTQGPDDLPNTAGTDKSNLAQIPPKVFNSFYAAGVTWLAVLNKDRIREENYRAASLMNTDVRTVNKLLAKKLTMHNIHNMS